MILSDIVYKLQIKALNFGFTTHGRYETSQSRLIMLKGVQRAKLRVGVAVVCSIIVIRNVIAMICH